MIKETLKHHGRPINKETQAIFCVNRVFEETFVPSLHNPMQEPIEPGQYVAWKRSNIVEDEEENTTHRRVRLVAREGYLKAARRQDSRYWQATKSSHNVCKCKGSCINNRCCCKKAGLKCGSKCHVGSLCCQNKL